MKNRQGPLTARHREIQSRFSDQWDYLYSDSLAKSKTFKKDKTQDEIDIVKHENEYTFQPNKNNKSSKLDSSVSRSQGGESPLFKQRSVREESFQIIVNIAGHKNVIIANLSSDPV